MPKIEITRTELVWPGKYDDQGQLDRTSRYPLPLPLSPYRGIITSLTEEKPRGFSVPEA